eukprot:TRINITY_DN2036_c0_g2_i1.p1 TRINITY_DN2036_c0_g2~~TRINITY_DN2036_c0_g2_i1.p1  ORF type:complete len:1066 (+),score=138.70 TRINITY_DN2036_c0_g2_i1:249-3446(+)
MKEVKTCQSSQISPMAAQPNPNQSDSSCKSMQGQNSQKSAINDESILKYQYQDQQENNEQESKAKYDPIQFESSWKYAGWNQYTDEESGLLICQPPSDEKELMQLRKQQFAEMNSVEHYFDQEDFWNSNYAFERYLEDEGQFGLLRSDDEELRQKKLQLYTEYLQNHPQSSSRQVGSLTYQIKEFERNAQANRLPMDKLFRKSRLTEEQIINGATVQTSSPVLEEQTTRSFDNYPSPQTKSDSDSAPSQLTNDSKTSISFSSQCKTSQDTDVGSETNKHQYLTTQNESQVNLEFVQTSELTSEQYQGITYAPPPPPPQDDDDVQDRSEVPNTKFENAHHNESQRELTQDEVEENQLSNHDTQNEVQDGQSLQSLQVQENKKVCDSILKQSIDSIQVVARIEQQQQEQYQQQYQPDSYQYGYNNRNNYVGNQFNQNYFQLNHNIWNRQYNNQYYFVGGSYAQQYPCIDQCYNNFAQYNYNYNNINQYYPNLYLNYYQQYYNQSSINNNLSTYEIKQQYQQQSQNLQQNYFNGAGNQGVNYQNSYIKNNEQIYQQQQQQYNLQQSYQNYYVNKQQQFNNLMNTQIDCSSYQHIPNFGQQQNQFQQQNNNIQREIMFGSFKNADNLQKIAQKFQNKVNIKNNENNQQNQIQHENNNLRQQKQKEIQGQKQNLQNINEIQIEEINQGKQKDIISNQQTNQYGNTSLIQQENNQQQFINLISDNQDEVVITDNQNIQIQSSQIQQDVINNQQEQSNQQKSIQNDENNSNQISQLEEFHNKNKKYKNNKEIIDIQQNQEYFFNIQSGSKNIKSQFCRQQDVLNIQQKYKDQQILLQNGDENNIKIKQQEQVKNIDNNKREIKIYQNCDILKSENDNQNNQTQNFQINDNLNTLNKNAFNKYINSNNQDQKNNLSRQQNYQQIYQDGFLKQQQFNNVEKNENYNLSFDTFVDKNQDVIKDNKYKQRPQQNKYQQQQNFNNQQYYQKNQQDNEIKQQKLENDNSNKYNINSKQKNQRTQNQYQQQQSFNHNYRHQDQKKIRKIRKFNYHINKNQYGNLSRNQKFKFVYLETQN